MTLGSSNVDLPKLRQMLGNPTWVSLAILLIIAFALFQPVVAFVVHEEVDYANHLMYLQETMDGTAIARLLSMFPHFVYHLLVYLVFKVLPNGSFFHAALVVSLAAYLLGTAAVFWLMTRMRGSPRTYSAGLVYAAITLALMLLMPINVLTPENLFVGYIGVNAYHNPTIVLLKPTAVVLFWCGGTIFNSAQYHKNGRQRRIVPIWACALASVVCVMAKSSYMIALLPALIVIAGYRALQRQPVDWLLLIWGIIIPAWLTLSLQIVLFQSSEGFMFAPLAVIYSWTRINPDAPNGMFPKFMLSILFPLLVYLLYFKAAIKDQYLNLAWVVFGFGAAYMYLLAESGERLGHVNFTWSAICALFILFIVSAIFLIRQLWGLDVRTPEATGSMRMQTTRFPFPARFIVCGYIFGLHLISGLYWYYIHVTAVSMGNIIAYWW